MINYDIKEIGSLEYFSLKCFYFFIQFKKYQQDLIQQYRERGNPKPGEFPAELLRVYYYAESFHVQLSEMYSFFEKKKDKELLGKLKLNATQRESHRKIRNGFSHFAKKGEPTGLEALSLRIDLMQEIGGSGDPEVDDYLTMVRYLKRMLNEPESFEKFKTHINGPYLDMLKLTGAKLDDQFLNYLLG